MYLEIHEIANNQIKNCDVEDKCGFLDIYLMECSTVFDLWLNYIDNFWVGSLQFA